MQDKLPKIPAEHIVPLNMNGLRGRMLRLPPKSTGKREVLFVYGHHSTLERWYGMAQVLNDFGGVTMPDLPGFGGMDSFYKIGEKPNLDTMADYLASFIKLRYRNRRLTIVGMSYGFLVITRMLQRYPDIRKKIDDVVSICGFVHHEDFVFSPRRKWLFKLGSRIFSWRLPALLFRNIGLHPSVIRAVYARTPNAVDKFTALDDLAYKENMDFEVVLWRRNDVRTHMFTTREFLGVDNCQKLVPMPLWHVYIDKDRYFDADLVDQHLRVVFESVERVKARSKNHSPSIVATKKDASSYIPARLRRHLKK